MADISKPGEGVSLIKHVTWVGFWVNAFLMAVKIAVGYYGHSDALVADGFHSLSDFATDFIVLVLVGIAYRGADDTHPWGHGKFETFASLLISVILAGVAVAIGYSGFKSIMHSLHGGLLPRPDIWTLIVALISILSKELLFRYTLSAGKRIHSGALIANAWHHRSDAISSIATLIGVAGALFFGEKMRILDPIASMLIGVFILISAWQIARPAVDELLERALDPKEVKRIGDIVASVPGVKGYHHLKTRRAGHSAVIDMHIKVDPDITVTQGHDIATKVEERLRARYDKDIITNIHVEPFHATDRAILP